ncbi:MAG: NAD(P)/FAD-dependent oxidoreductase [Candidatus Omnitrophica bacterium]|nr:NAD(P)/FAD-dependent oxidoreductase [Candidatus Omnitrophota bacterium]
MVIIGGGPAGIMAALRAAELQVPSVVLVERNASLARKLGLTGKGRCNVTNDAPVEEFCLRFGKNGVFLRGVFSRFFSGDLAVFFEDRGLKLKTERQGRVFPETDSSSSIVSLLSSELKKMKVDVRLRHCVGKIKIEPDRKIVFFEGAEPIATERLIIAVGGSSFPVTGSAGDGFAWARQIGHTVVPLRAGLVPLETKETFVKDVQGLALKNVRLTFSQGRHRIETPIGEMLFTHFGISGPLVLDVSAAVADLLDQGGVQVSIDLKVGLSSQELDKKFQDELPAAGSAKLGNYFKSLLPGRLIDIFLRAAQVDPEKKCHQITAMERRHLVVTLKAFRAAVKRTRPLSEGMVTCGGVSLKEINPKTMESRIVPGVYFCGEVLDLAASSGGYNLQAAFSTGYVAGESAALSLEAK